MDRTYPTSKIGKCPQGGELHNIIISITFIFFKTVCNILKYSCKGYCPEILLLINK